MERRAGVEGEVRAEELVEVEVCVSLLTELHESATHTELRRNAATHITHLFRQQQRHTHLLR